MREYYSIPSREEAERFSEAYLAAQREYHEWLEEFNENFPELKQRSVEERFKIMKDAEKPLEGMKNDE